MQVLPCAQVVAERGSCQFEARIGEVAERRWKLASYEVAGNVFAMFVRPEWTMDSAVHSGRISFGALNQTLCVWLISGCPVGTNKDSFFRLEGVVECSHEGEV
jgi:hypothetical protein